MAKLFTISEAASIALHSMVLVAKNEHRIKATQIAEMTGSSKNHIAKVLQRLVKDNLLASGRGPDGGFYLKRDPNEITFYDIYCSIEGHIEISECPAQNKKCPFEKCILGDVGNKMAAEFVAYLKNETLQKILK